MIDNVQVSDIRGRVWRCSGDGGSRRLLVLRARSPHPPQQDQPLWCQKRAGQCWWLSLELDTRLLSCFIVSNAINLHKLIPFVMSETCWLVLVIVSRTRRKIVVLFIVSNAINLHKLIPFSNLNCFWKHVYRKIHTFL